MRLLAVLGGSLLGLGITGAIFYALLIHAPDLPLEF